MWLSERNGYTVLTLPPIPRVVSLAMLPLKRDYFLRNSSLKIHLRVLIGCAV